MDSWEDSVRGWEADEYNTKLEKSLRHQDWTDDQIDKFMNPLEGLGREYGKIKRGDVRK